MKIDGVSRFEARSALDVEEKQPLDTEEKRPRDTGIKVEKVASKARAWAAARWLKPSHIGTARNH